MSGKKHDFDWVIVGSGFGGSVSALRLAEKGYRVAVIEVGRRFADEDFAKTAWNMRRYFWMPNIGLRGILRMTPFKDVLVVSGAGVGGGSLGYANTLYRPRQAFYRDPQWGDLADWEVELGPHYVTAERMLGVTLYRDEGPADQLLHQYAAETGADDTYSNTQVGVHFGEPGVTVPDPYFGGEGPDRTGCNKCGSCMVGCRYGAKNTLVKNYLYFAEKLGAEVFPGVAGVGEKAPVVSTPTAASVGGDLAKIDTRQPPSSMHDADLKDVLGSKPAIVVFATPAFCASRVCGPVVDVAEQVKAESGDGIQFIHMEVFNDNDPSKGIRPQLAAFGLPTEPWVFAIGSDGRIVQRTEGALGIREMTGIVRNLKAYESGEKTDSAGGAGSDPAP